MRNKIINIIWLLIIIIISASCTNTPITPEISVSLSGNENIGSVINCSYILMSNEVIVKSENYQWLRSDTVDGDYDPIQDAVNNEYTITNNDMDHYIACEVSIELENTNIEIPPVMSSNTGKILGRIPTAKNITITGTAKINHTITAEYEFIDEDGDSEGTSVYRWLRLDEPNGDYTRIEGANNKSYTLTNDDLYKYIKFEVTPVSENEPEIGYPVKSEVYERIGTEGDNPPTVSNIDISGLGMVGVEVEGTYDYDDADGDPESDTEFQWLRCDTPDGVYEEITHATNQSYVLTIDELNMYIKLKVTPKAVVSPDTGDPLTSSAFGPVIPADDNTWIKVNDENLIEDIDYPINRSRTDLVYYDEGKVMLFGGYSYPIGIYSDTWFFDSGDMTWSKMDYNGLSPGEGYPQGRAGVNIEYAGNGVVLAFGGLTLDAFLNIINLNDTWEFNSNTTTWTMVNEGGDTGEGADFPNARTMSGIAYSGYNEVYLFCGAYTQDDDLIGIFDMWKYNSINKHWTEIDISPLTPDVTVPTKRAGHTMEYIGNNKIILFGGIDDTEQYLNDTWIYEIDNNLWRKIDYGSGIEGTDYPNARMGHAMAYTGYNNLIILFGGTYDNGSTTLYDDTWIFDSTTETWDKLEYDPEYEAGRNYPEGRTSTLAYTGQNKVVLFGGGSENEAALGETWIFYPTMNEW